MSPVESETCWVLTEGKAGMENQCLGLAEAVGLPITVKRARLRAPWKWLAPHGIGDALQHLAPGSARLAPPWPRLLIACGRQSIPLAIAIKRASGGKTFLVQTQHPRVNLAPFDLVVPPLHDGLDGPNVMPILGAPHRVNAARLAEAKEKWRTLFAPRPCPRVAVIIGGKSKTHDLPKERAAAIADMLSARARGGASLMVTLSRRTPPESATILSERLRAAGAYVWDGEGPNPYFGMLAWADAILVTADSVSMITEAAATGRPVHIIDLPGGSPKFDRFHEEMGRRGVTRPFRGRIESWRYLPLNETARVAAEIRRRIGVTQAQGRVTAA